MTPEETALIPLSVYLQSRDAPDVQQLAKTYKAKVIYLEEVPTESDEKAYAELDEQHGTANVSRTADMEKPLLAIRLDVESRAKAQSQFPNLTPADEYFDLHIMSAIKQISQNAELSKIVTQRLQKIAVLSAIVTRRLQSGDVESLEDLKSLKDLSHKSSWIDVLLERWNHFLNLVENAVQNAIEYYGSDSSQTNSEEEEKQEALDTSQNSAEEKADQQQQKDQGDESVAGIAALDQRLAAIAAMAGKDNDGGYDTDTDNDDGIWSFKDNVDYQNNENRSVNSAEEKAINDTSISSSVAAPQSNEELHINAYPNHQKLARALEHLKLNLKTAARKKCTEAQLKGMTNYYLHNQGTLEKTKFSKKVKEDYGLSTVVISFVFKALNSFKET